MTPPIHVPLLEPSLHGNERRYLGECVDTNYVSSVGPMVPRFEAAFAETVGSSHAIACASGTAAIHLALLALGISAGDEVWVSDLTFVASANPARYCGAIVTLVDSEQATWNLDPGLVESELRRRDRLRMSLPAAIVVVHILGHPADLGPVLDVARRFGVPVVEDAAESLGARWIAGSLDGLSSGTAGTIGCFSFNGNKVVTTGSGGMVVTSDAALANRARHLANQAGVPNTDYEHDGVGHNYRMSNVSAALGLAQLEQLERFLAAKRAIAARYDSAFSDMDGIGLAPRARSVEPSAWLYTVLLRSSLARSIARTALREAGIDSRPIWRPLHRQVPYQGSPVLGGGQVAEDIGDRGLSLPSSVGLDANRQDEVVAVLREIVEWSS